MAHSYHHAISSARKFGGRPDDYTGLHTWFDRSKEIIADFRHRALRHHAEGIVLAETVFGVTIRNSDGREVPVRLIGEQHVTEDLGRVPSFADWVRCIRPEPWMGRIGTKLADIDAPPLPRKPAMRDIGVMTRTLRAMRDHGGVAKQQQRGFERYVWFAGNVLLTTAIVDPEGEFGNLSTHIGAVTIRAS